MNPARNPYQFLDDILRTEDTKDHFRETLRSSLQKGTLQIIRSVFPDTSITQAQIAQTFAAVRVLLSYGLFLSSSGNLQIARNILRKEGIFTLSRQAANALCPLFLREDFLDYQLELHIRYDQELRHPSAPILVYRTLLHSALPPERTILRMQAKSEEAQHLYRLGAAQHAVYQSHQLPLYQDGLPIHSDLLTSLVLLHRILFWTEQDRPYTLSIKAIRDRLQQSTLTPSQAAVVETEAWQHTFLPEIQDRGMREAFISESILPLIARNRPEDRGLISFLWELLPY